LRDSVCEFAENAKLLNEINREDGIREIEQIISSDSRVSLSLTASEFTNGNDIKTSDSTYAPVRLMICDCSKGNWLREFAERKESLNEINTEERIKETEETICSDIHVWLSVPVSEFRKMTDMSNPESTHPPVRLMSCDCSNWNWVSEFAEIEKSLDDIKREDGMKHME
jgi:hypothetical protein